VAVRPRNGSAACGSRWGHLPAPPLRPARKRRLGFQFFPWGVSTSFLRTPCGGSTVAAAALWLRRVPWGGRRQRTLTKSYMLFLAPLVGRGDCQEETARPFAPPGTILRRGEHVVTFACWSTRVARPNRCYRVNEIQYAKGHSTYSVFFRSISTSLSLLGWAAKDTESFRGFFNQPSSRRTDHGFEDCVRLSPICGTLPKSEWRGVPLCGGEWPDPCVLLVPG